MVVAPRPARVPRFNMRTSQTRLQSFRLRRLVLKSISHVRKKRYSVAIETICVRDLDELAVVPACCGDLAKNGSAPTPATGVSSLS